MWQRHWPVSFWFWFIRMQTQDSRAKHELKDLKDTGVIYSCESNEPLKGRSKFKSILDRLSYSMKHELQPLIGLFQRWVKVCVLWITILSSSLIYGLQPPCKLRQNQLISHSIHDYSIFHCLPLYFSKLQRNHITVEIHNAASVQHHFSSWARRLIWFFLELLLDL